MKLRKSTWMVSAVCVIAFINVGTVSLGTQRLDYVVTTFSYGAFGAIVLCAARYMQNRGD